MANIEASVNIRPEKSCYQGKRKYTGNSKTVKKCNGAVKYKSKKLKNT